MAVVIPAGALGFVLRSIGRPLLGSAAPPAVQRLGTVAVCAAMPRVGGTQRSAREIAGVGVLELTPADASVGSTLLYFHGGGYMVGSARAHLPLLSHLALAAQMRVVAVDYRLAPEHPFPAAFDDAVAVYDALLAGGQDPARLVVAGDSAGGGLALASVLAARDAGRPLPARMVLFSPWLDLRRSASGEDRGDALLRARGLDRWADAYCAGGSRRDPRASPLLGSLEGLESVSVLVQYDTAETLADQSVAFIAAAEAAGVPVTSQPFSGYWHDFQLFTLLPAARTALRLAGEFAAA